MDTVMQVFTLGGLSIQRGETPLADLNARKAGALLVYLLSQRRPQAREVLADLLWDERSQRQALSNIRGVLTDLRKSLGSYLVITRETVALNPEQQIWFDAAALEAGLDAMRAAGGIRSAGDAGQVEQLVDLYRGEFLEGFYVRDSRGFEAWMVQERERLHRLATGALHDLIAYYLQSGAYPAGIARASQLLKLDPLMEAAHRQMMQLLAYRGQRSEALAQYEACRRLLWDELGVEPSAATKALYEKIRSGELVRSRTPLRAVRGYELVEPIGSGSYGAVYRAYQPSVGREVAVKVILPQYANDPDFIRRFEVEAQIVARLEHPHIVPLYDYWREPDGAYLVMRLLKGGSLEQALEAGSLETGQAVALVEQVAAGLALAHGQGVIHRDLKPANILLDEGGNAYLADFGIAKVLGGNERQTQTGGLLGTPVYLSPEQIRSQPVSPQTDVYSLGIILYQVLVGEVPFPDDSLAGLIEKHLHQPLPSVRGRRADLPEAVDGVIQRATAKDPAERFPDALALAAAFRQALGGLPVAALEEAVPIKEPAVGIANPYKGLSAFQEVDAANFFGREALVDRLVDRLGEGGVAARFLAVVGPSGSGKSSLVKAGLIPALRGGALSGSEKWFIIEMIPGSHPFEELEINLLRIATNPSIGLMEHMRRDPRGLLRAARLALPAAGSELLLVIDQFEELFTLVEDKGEANQFLESLYAAVSEPRSPLWVVVTLRADFYDRPLMHSEFSTLVQERTEVVVPLSVDELERAIRAPAERVGVAVEPGLVTAMVSEVAQQPNALPLLQYALTELFERRKDHRLSSEDYQAMGRVEGVLEQRAEAVFAGLDETGKAAARQAFLRLVTLGEGVEDTRRRVLRSELEALAGADTAVPEQDELESGPARGRQSMPVGEVIDAFGTARLLSFDRDPASRSPTVEVAHEALLREWPRLREWLNESRADLRMQRVLASAAADWQQAGRESSFLLRGVRLDQFAAWIETTELALTHDERVYLEASLADRAARRAAETARQERERALERRSRNVLRGLVGVFAAAALVAVLLSLFAFNQQRLARQLADLRSREAQVNQSLALAAQSRLALQADNLDLALALAMEAIRIPDPPGRAQMALSEAAYAPGTVRRFIGHQAAIHSVAVSPDGRYGLSGDEDGVIFLWDLESGEVLRRLAGHEAMVASLAFTPDGRHAVSGSQDKTLIHWDLDTGEVIHHFTGHQAGVNTVAVSPDGRLAASGSGRFSTSEPFSAEDNSLRLWDLQIGEEIRRFTLFTDSVTDVSFTPDGRQLAAATMSDGLTLFDVSTGKALVRPGNWDPMTEVVISPDGHIALTAGEDSLSITRWDLQTGEAEWLGNHNCVVHGLSVSPDGKRALSGSCIDVIEWDLETGEQMNRFNFPANAIVYSPDGRRALIGSEDNTLRLWALQSGAEIGRLPAGIFHIRGVAYSPNGQTVVTDDTAYLSHWDLTTGDRIWTGTSSTGSFWEIALSPDGKQVLASELFGYASLWDAATGKVLKRLESDGSFIGHGTGDYVDAVAFHPSGKFGLSGSQTEYTQLIYWDLETGKPVWLFKTESVLGVAISPDGRTALSAEGDGAVNWWDLETGQLIRRLEGHTNLAWGVAFVDDRTALSASDDSTMILWDLESGTAIRSFLGHAGGIKRVALSPDKRLALSASRDGTLILWDIQSGEPLRRYAGHTDELMAVGWHPDGGEALSGGRDTQAIRWRIDAALETFLDWIEQNRAVRALTCAERDAFRVEPLCESGTAATEAERDASSAPVEGKPAALLPPLPIPTPLVIEPSPTPAVALEAGAAAWGVNQGSIHTGGGQAWEYAGNAGDRLSIRVAAENPADRTWGIDRQRESGLLDPILTLYAPDGVILAESDDLENGVATDAYLASITLPQTGMYRIEVRSYQDQTGGDYRLILADPRPLVFKTGLPDMGGLAIHPNGRTALVGVGSQTSTCSSDVSDNHRIWIWDLVTGEVVRQMEGHCDTAISIAVSADGRQALSAGLDGQAILWDLETGEEVQRLDNAGQAFNVILFHPDGRSALTSSDMSPALWDLVSGKVVRRFEGHDDLVPDMALSPDGKTAYSTSADNTVRAWDVASGEQIGDSFQPFPAGQTNGLAVSPDGGRLLVGGGEWLPMHYERQDTVIALLDASTGDTLLNLEGHTSLVISVVFSPDGRFALSGSTDKTVRLWDLDTGELLATFSGHTDEVKKVAFSPDGLTGYSTSLDGSFRVWDLREFIPSSESASTER